MLALSSRKKVFGLMAVFLMAVIPIFGTVGTIHASAYAPTQNPCTNEALMMIVVCGLFGAIGIIPGIVCGVIVVAAGYGTGCQG